MDEIEVDLVDPELFQGGVERLADCVRRQILVPDLCRDMQIVASDAGSRERGADGLLVGIHFGGVDMPVAERERALHRRAAGIALHAEGTEPELGQADALGLHIFH